MTIEHIGDIIMTPIIVWKLTWAQALNQRRCGDSLAEVGVTTVAYRFLGEADKPGKYMYGAL